MEQKGNQYSPLHKVISINDLTDGNIITNAYGLCFSRSGSFSQSDIMEIFDSETAVDSQIQIMASRH